MFPPGTAMAVAEWIQKHHSFKYLPGGVVCLKCRSVLRYSYPHLRYLRDQTQYPRIERCTMCRAGSLRICDYQNWKWRAKINEFTYIILNESLKAFYITAISFTGSSWQAPRSYEALVSIRTPYRTRLWKNQRSLCRKWNLSLSTARPTCRSRILNPLNFFWGLNPWVHASSSNNINTIFTDWYSSELLGQQLIIETSVIKNIKGR